MRRGKMELLKQDIKQELRDQLANQYACYVLITCDEPTPDGKMNIEMNYEGDAALAAYMIEGAQGVIDIAAD